MALCRRMAAIMLITFFAGAVHASADETVDAPSPRRITTGAPQIFVDLSDVESSDNVKQLFHTAEKHSANPVLAPEYPWERKNGAPTASAIYDADEKLFKMWYYGIRGTTEGLADYGPHTLCYATSTDGVHWDRPKLGLHEFDGSKDNNIVVPLDYHDGKDHWESVLKDSFDPDDSRRYKAIGWSSKTGALHTMTSPDGLNWTHSPGPVFTKVGDAQALMIDHVRKRYVAFIRSGDRLYSTSEDFVHWSEKGVSVKAGPGEGSNVQYNHVGFNYGDVYLGFMSYFHRNKSWPLFPRLDVRLLSSRDGLAYDKPGDDWRKRPPLAACGDVSQWDRWIVMLTGAPPIVVGDKLYIYFRGMSRQHGPFDLEENADSHYAGAIGLAVLRRDGFASLAAGFDGGQITTTAFVFEGSTLTINAMSGPGDVRVEMLDTNGKPIAGYTKDECNPVTGDSVEHTVTWRNKEDVRELTGRPVKLRFHLANARLYAYAIRP